MKAVLIPAQMRRPVEIVDVGNGWHTFARAINASYVERVACLLTRDHDEVLVVDEEGLYHQTYNRRADVFYGDMIRARGDWVPGIHGDALVMAEGYTSEGPDLIDLPDPEATLHRVLAELQTRVL